MLAIVVLVFSLNLLVKAQIPDRLNWDDFQKYQICNAVIIEECFKDMDANGDKIVTTAEMQEYWQKNNKRIEKMDEERYNWEFNQADKNHDNILSADEVDSFLNQFYNLTPAFESFFKNDVDKNSDGQLDKEEFVYLRKHGSEI